MRLRTTLNEPMTNQAGPTRRRAPGGLSASLVLPALALLAVFAAACSADPTATPTPTATPVPAPTATPTPEPPPSDEDLTHAYVTSAIDYYGKNGREATVEFYKSGESIEDGRTLILIDKAESVLLAYQPIPALAGQLRRPGFAIQRLREIDGPCHRRR